MQCKAQSVQCSCASQAISNETVRPKLAREMCILFVNKSLAQDCCEKWQRLLGITLE